MSGALALSLGETGFSPSTQIFTVGSGTVTIPAGATTLVIEVFGASGNGGTGAGTGCSATAGGGGGSGGYSKTTVSVVGSSGLTVSYNIGAPTSASSGTFAITTMSCNAGANGVNAPPNGAGGGGGTASGGTDTNTTGNAGGSGGGCAGGTGGAGRVGVLTSGFDGGHGGFSNTNIGRTTGGSGKVAFRFT